jgi:hypothetical protein
MVTPVVLFVLRGLPSFSSAKFWFCLNERKAVFCEDRDGGMNVPLEPVLHKS